MTEVLQIGSPIVLMCLGAAFLFLGYRLVKVVAVVNLAVLGAMVGHDVAKAADLSPPIWGAAIGGALCGLLAIPLLRAAVVVAVASLAALVAKNAWVTLGGRPPLQWAALVGGFVLGGILALVFFRFIMIATSSVMGAGLVVYGAASLLSRDMVTTEHIQRARPLEVVGCAAFLVLLVLVGMVAQYRGAKRLRARSAES